MYGKQIKLKVLTLFCGNLNDLGDLNFNNTVVDLSIYIIQLRSKDHAPYSVSSMQGSFEKEPIIKETPANMIIALWWAKTFMSAVFSYRIL